MGDTGAELSPCQEQWCPIRGDPGAPLQRLLHPLLLGERVVRQAGGEGLERLDRLSGQRLDEVGQLQHVAAE